MKILAILVALCGAAMGANGLPVRVGKPIALGGEAVMVQLKAHEAMVGPDKAVMLRGAVVSRLPHEYFKVTLDIRCWDVYTNDKTMFERGHVIIEIERPKPGRKVPFEALMRFQNAEGNYSPFAMPEPIYTVSVSFEKQTAATERTHGR